MDPRTAMEAALAEAVEPVLQAAGFSGAPFVWRRRNDAGDWVVVTVDVVGGEGRAQCSIGLAAVPAPWLGFMGVWLGMPPVEVHESIGLYRDRLAPPDWVASTPESAEEVAADVARRMVTEVIPRLNTLQSRAAVLETVRAGDLGILKHEDYPRLFTFAEAVLISEDGLSERLEELLAQVQVEERDPQRQQQVERYVLWIHERAKERGSD